jgi:hypothetical protein
MSPFLRLNCLSLSPICRFVLLTHPFLLLNPLFPQFSRLSLSLIRLSVLLIHALLFIIRRFRMPDPDSAVSLFPASRSPSCLFRFVAMLQAK